MRPVAYAVGAEQHVGLALAAFEAHPTQTLPRPVVALEELGLGEAGASQEGQPPGMVDDDQADLDLVEQAADLGRVEVVGEKQRNGPGHPGGELELELADAGGDADDHDLAGVDPCLDHAGRTVDDVAVELVPGQRPPRAVILLDDGHGGAPVAGMALQPGERGFLGTHDAPPTTND